MRETVKLESFQWRARNESKTSKEFYCLGSRGVQDLNVTIDLRNYKSTNYFVRKQSYCRTILVLILYVVNIPFSTEDMVLNSVAKKYCHTFPRFIRLIGGKHTTWRAAALKSSPVTCPKGRKCGETGRLGTKFEESLDRRRNSLCGMWWSKWRFFSKPGRLAVSSISCSVTLILTTRKTR